ncbi:MAG: hypothetical protein Q9160_001522 [Pyrenula sp. 1 TL-2023]
MKTLLLIFSLYLIVHIVVSDQACLPNDFMCSEASKACNDQKYQYLTPAEDLALKALIIYNHVNEGSKRRDESSANVLRSAKFYNRQAGNTHDSITFDPKYDSMESADLTGLSARPLQQFAETLAGEIQGVMGTDLEATAGQSGTLPSRFSDDEIENLNRMATEMSSRLQQRQQSQALGAQTPQSPQNSVVQDVNIFNGFCRVLTRCGSSIAQGFGSASNSIRYGARRAGSAIVKSPLALISLGLVGLLALIVGIAVGFSRSRGGSTATGVAPATGPPVGTKGSRDSAASGRVLFTHFRVLLRGGAPKDIPQQQDPIVVADGELPDSAKKYLTKDSPNMARRSAVSNKHQPNRRDQREDNFCLPTRSKELNDVVYNIWQMVYKPRQASHGITSEQYHIAHTASGAFDVANGGSVILKIWTTQDEPDLDRLKAPINSLPSLSEAPNWSDPKTPTQRPPDGQVCYDEWLPTNSNSDPNTTTSGPPISWWNAFSDACKASFGSNRAATPNSFTYFGAGLSDNPTNSAGWLGEFVADPTCKRKFACKDLVGGSGDGRAGLAKLNVETCTARAFDGRYHGGVVYMNLVQAKAGAVGGASCAIGPWTCPGNRIGREGCGFMRVTPLA